MAKQGGMGDHFYVGGVALGGDVQSLSGIHGGPAPWETTDITQSAFSRIGLRRDGGVSGVIYFNTAAGRAHLTLRPLPTTSVNATYGIGQAVGNPAASTVAKQINYDPTEGTDGSLTFGVDWQASDATGLEWGFQGTAGIRTDTAATNGTGVDRGAALASTAFGAAAYLHVFAFTGTSVTVKVQDSADNVSFADVTGLTFTAATAAGFERIATATTATIRRYLRVATTGTFSNAQFMVNMVPYEVAQP